MNHPNSKSRELALKFLYQCHCEKIFYYSKSHLEDFQSQQKIPEKFIPYLQTLIKNIFDSGSEIDELIENCSKNWSLSRLATIDKCILRISCCELILKEIDKEIIIDEAIELAKNYGSEQSGKFVNGVLDAMIEKIQ